MALRDIIAKQGGMLFRLQGPDPVLLVVPAWLFVLENSERIGTRDNSPLPARLVDVLFRKVFAEEYARAPCRRTLNAFVYLYLFEMTPGCMFGPICRRFALGCLEKDMNRDLQFAAYRGNLSLKKETLS